VAALTGPGTGATVTRLSGSIDVHLVTHEYVGRGRRLPSLAGGLTARRRIAGLVAAAITLTVLTVVCAALRSHLSLGTEGSLFLLAVIVTSLVGGFYPALAAAVAGSLLLNYYFVPPLHTLTIAQPANIVAVAIFLLTAVLVSQVVDVAAKRSAQAARATAEAETLSTFAGSLLRGEQSLPALLERVRETFAMRSVSLVRRRTDAPASSGPAGQWDIVATVGADPPRCPPDGDASAPIDDDHTLVLCGRTLPAEDQRVLTAFAAQVGVAYRQGQLVQAAAAIEPLAESERQRTALLNAVSHDLRSPIAAAKAAVTSLHAPDVDWDPEARHELLDTADAALDRLTELVTNLLDLSRLEAGALPVLSEPVGLDDVVAHAIRHADGKVDVDVPADLPEVLADAGLLERVVANLLQNALRYSPDGQPVRIAGSAHADHVELRVIDRGPGIPPDAVPGIFEAFQRSADSSADGAGVGLGLAIARGFTNAMGGTIAAEETPGGGATLVVALQAAR
jgi:two-component system, OmpR family, sensor histidine kinase KdpD